MAELKNMTVQALRELARKALGRGHSKLKTKSELVAALQAATKDVSAAAEKAAARVKEATGRAAKQAVESARATGKAVKQRAEERGRARRAKARGAAPAAKGPAAAEPVATPPVRPEPRRDEPDADGYFVARVRGEDAVRGAPHPMTESALEEQGAPERARGAAPRPRPEAERGRRGGPRAAARHEESLGELPWAYGDDTFLALPRDPRTLFLYWDHHDETVRGGFEGLEGGRAELWIFARNAAGGWDRVRVVDFALESRSWYVHDLDPGRVYRAEIHLVDASGADKLLSATSNETGLPPYGPSPVIDDKFMRIPWGEPLQRLLRQLRPGAPFPEDLRALLLSLSDWSRFVGPSWGSGSGGPFGGPGAGAGPGAGGPGGRPSGPSGGPTSPSSPWGPWSGSGEGR